MRLKRSLPPRIPPRHSPLDNLHVMLISWHSCRISRRHLAGSLSEGHIDIINQPLEACGNDNGKRKI
jgi:hypothetical protein